VHRPETNSETSGKTKTEVDSDHSPEKQSTDATDGRKEKVKLNFILKV
jgi:hypothetical protein